MEKEALSWRVSFDDLTLRLVWPYLSGQEVLLWSRAHRCLWTSAVELVTQRLARPALFAALTSQERGSVLRALPIVEDALLFENFSSHVWSAGSSACNVASGAGEYLPDARGGDPCRGCWFLGPGTFVPPHMERRLIAGATMLPGQPLSVWSLSMVNRDPDSDLDPSGLVWRFPASVRPRRASFRCRLSAKSTFRCGGVFALSEGLGNDKGPERPIVFVHFTRDSDGRQVAAQQEGGTSVMLDSWLDEQWCHVDIWFDWDRKTTRFKVESIVGYDQRIRTRELRFKTPSSDGCRYLLLYNQTCDFEAAWTDILIV